MYSRMQGGGGADAVGRAMGVGGSRGVGGAGDVWGGRVAGDGCAGEGCRGCADGDVRRVPARCGEASRRRAKVRAAVEHVFA